MWYTRLKLVPLYVEMRKLNFQKGQYHALAQSSVSRFYPRELAKLRGYTSCFVVAVVACLLVLYSLKQFDNPTMQQGSHARKQFGILPLKVTAERLYAV
jgi:hypothetical protein